ncbi:O-methyltransferase [Nocardiopsis composta]|uniref:Putative O-methyltransferase YrrM n=1 Tax=Nocardiopsis composta TaxID=157465 RepID=A0A7W8QSJ1_9ACTN|nr:O-methyltransferase [Nocardiopsis composta]MBB5434781.1 putative O-methyltransferase YrrM [Nocardiopsis composta]
MWEAAIIGRNETLAHLEHYADDDPALAWVREAAGADPGAQPVSAACGAALRFLAAAIGARAAVEVGTGYGGSGIWLLRGMRPDSILTTVDIDPVCQETARDAYREAGFSANRTRLIRGRALEVLPRLTDGAYDLVFADAMKSEYPAYLAEALRLLRPGGVVVFHDALESTPAGDGPLSAPDPGTAAVREVGRAVREDDSLVPLLLPIGEGLLAAIREEAPRS